ncbi:MAG: GntR family transcriptional regulator, transcriptional repressor for pyruvate dehydrogenase complex [Actinomycetota bacterium]|nr:GntR family transcriptional regulator, transcriptional repressor for pyruvate dehydrogenase complex [Actinomycetota bacterium]
MPDITFLARGPIGRRTRPHPPERASGSLPNPSPGAKSFEALLAEVERQLRDGDLRSGQRLASERSLAERLGISRASVREGLRVLQTLGFLRTVSGRGRESHTVITSRTSEALSVALRLHAATGGLSLTDLIETRVVLETAVARTLSELLVPPGCDPAAGGGGKRTAPGESSDLLREAEAVGRQMRDPEISPVGFHELDTRFHDALARAAGNPLLRTLIGALALAERPLVPDPSAQSHGWETTCAGLRLQHSALLTAVRRGDATMAVALVEDHVRAQGALLLRAEFNLWEETSPAGAHGRGGGRGSTDLHVVRTGAGEGPGGRVTDLSCSELPAGTLLR